MKNNNTYDQFTIKKNGANASSPSQYPYDNFDLNADRYNNNDTMNTKDFMTGALFGAFVGAAAALMMAPKSGRELRDGLNLQTGSLKERASELTETAKDKTVSLTKAVQEQSTGLVDKVKSLKSGDNAGNTDSENEKGLDGKSLVENVIGATKETVGATKETVDTTADTAKNKLDETKKALEELEKSAVPSASQEEKSDSEKTAAGWIDPAGKGINESKPNGGLNSSTTNNSSNQMNNRTNQANNNNNKNFNKNNNKLNNR